MTDTVTSQNIDLSFSNGLCIPLSNYSALYKMLPKSINQR